MFAYIEQFFVTVGHVAICIALEIQYYEIIVETATVDHRPKM